MAFILHKHTDHGVDTTEVSGALLRIGRGTNTDLRFDNDAVDLEHAQIQQQDGHSILVDKNSVNVERRHTCHTSVLGCAASPH